MRRARGLLRDVRRTSTLAAARVLARYAGSARAAHRLPLDEQYQLWLAKRRRTRDDGDAILRSLRGRPLMSVVMPVHETQPSWLVAAVESVRAQRYPEWELCIADDGSRRSDTRETLARLAADDRRIRVARLDEPEGIAAASNVAAQLGTGELVALVDHDDVLAPDALLRVMHEFDGNPELDIVYTDEDKLEEGGRRVEPFFKPDWSPDLLLSTNYVGHLVVIRKSLFDSIGGFRLGFDGSQDYDLVLRATEVARGIGHVASPLYSWRRVPGSAAAVPDAKPYAFEAAKRALSDADRRHGHEGVVENGLFLGSYRVRRVFDRAPHVAIVVTGRHSDIGAWTDRLRARTRYPSYEILTLGEGVDAEQVLFCTADLDPENVDWLQAMVEATVDAGVGAVGARVLRRDGGTAHEGVVVRDGVAELVDHHDYFGLGRCARNWSGVAAPLLTPAPLFAELGGLCVESLGALAPVDYCLRARERGFRIVYTPYARFISRREIHADRRAAKVFAERWRAIDRDPFYNDNLSRSRLFRLNLEENDDSRG